MWKIGCLFLLLLLAACEKRNTPGSTAVTGETTTAESAQGRAPTATELETGARVYRQVCATCHEEGIAGAPKMGDEEAWKPSLAQGMDTMIRHSIEGFQGNLGIMPPKGGAKSLTDEEVIAAVRWMVRQVEQNK